MGPPFTCRRRHRGGLNFPTVSHWPLFICECCTVRSVLDRELGGSQDRILLKLERMRILDVANSWAQGTLETYSSKVNFIRRFEAGHEGLSILAYPQVAKPPRANSIPLAWAELQYSLSPSPHPDRETVAYGTIRQLRSAVAWHHTAANLVGKAGDFCYDGRQQRLLRLEGVGPQDGTMTHFTKGFKERIGDSPTPSWALLDRHIRAFDLFFESNYIEASTTIQQRRWALAGLANLFLWLGWLRSSELFNLRWQDITCIEPEDGPQWDLPPNVGGILLRLKEQTKSQRTRTADVPIAYTTRSGYRAGRWFARARALRLVPTPTEGDPTYVFQDEGGTQWDSYYFRHEFVYPLLYKLRLEGDPALTPLDGTGSNTIPLRYHSLHMYRRGARSHCDIIRESPTVRRKASPVEVYEHGRWRRNRGNEAIDVMYREWTLFDRLQLTLFCM